MTNDVQIQSAPKWAWAVWGVLIFVALVINYCSTPSPPSATTSSSPPNSSSVGRETEALIFAGECITPCKLDIQFKFKIRGEGNPLRITFPGVDQPVDYPGEGDFKAPEGMEKGDTYFTSLNEKRPNVRVQLYKKITVRQ